MLPRSMFVHSENFKTQMNAYSNLIAGTIFLVHEELGSGPIRSKNFGEEIADEIITFETQLAKVLEYDFILKIHLIHK